METALIIGATSLGGLGEATVRRLAADGMSVIVAGRRIEAAAHLAEAYGGRAFACDVTDEDSIKALAAAAGPVDVLVNAAGTTSGRSIVNISRGEIEAQFAVHVTANILLLKHVVPMMSPGARVILFSSLTASVAGAGTCAYAAAKAGLEQVVRVAAIEFGDRGVRINAVAPGFSHTPMTDSFLSQDNLSALYRREAALGALVTPDQVAAAVSYLAAVDCFASGEILHVSGGAQLGRLPRRNEIKAGG